MMNIRPTHTHEIPQIAAIHEQTATVAYAHIFPNQPFPHAETLARWQRFPGQILVAEVENVLVGFVAFDAEELHALYVLPEYQGQGIGRRLLAAAGAVSALWVLKENHAARCFYAAHGWAPDGTERVAFGVVEMRYQHPAIHEHCQMILQSVALVEQISALVGTTSYIWGGLTLDVYAGRLLRKHDDIDYLTVNLCELREAFTQQFATAGCTVSTVANGDPVVRGTGIKLHLGQLMVDGRARWVHNPNAPDGVLEFPATWLALEASTLYNQTVHVVKPELEYVLKCRPDLLNPQWTPRPKDVTAKAALEKMLYAEKVEVQDLFTQVCVGEHKLLA
ncbi:MAG: GNAT family N-acetyltransferase [Caldilineaceae bacterium]